MAVHNNDILMLHYEDLPDEDKGVISKATEEFQNKCLLSYTKTRDNIIVQKFALPRVLLHGQIDTTEAKDKRFFKEVVDNLFVMPYQAITKLSWTYSTML